MSSIKTLNPKAEVMSRVAALFMTINAAKGLRDVMATNLGPAGTIKMLVDGAGGTRERAHIRRPDLNPASTATWWLRVGRRG